MSDFIPPYPKRPTKPPGVIELIKSARHDWLAIWPESAFDRQFMVLKIVNRSLVIANHPEIVQHVLLTNAGNYRKNNTLLRRTLTPLLGDSLFVSDGASWQNRRELLTTLFSPSRLNSYGAIMADVLADWVRLWPLAKPEGNLSVVPEMRRLSASLLSRVCFGLSAAPDLPALLSENLAAYWTTVEQLDIAALFGLPSWFSGKSATASNIAKTLHTAVAKLIADYDPASAQASLLAQFLSLKSATGLTREQIRDELLGLALIGQETIANTLAWAWYLISQCPDVEQRLHDEVDAVLAAGTAVVSDFDKLVYSRAIIEETLRLYPPLPLLIWEAVADDRIRDRVIPAGSMIMVAPWLLHRHKQYWNQPDHFIPERFLGDEPISHELAYLPFGVGARACLARDFSLLAMTLSLAIVARNFRLQSAPGYRLEPACRLLLRPSDELPMQLTRRT